MFLIVSSVIGFVLFIWLIRVKRSRNLWLPILHIYNLPRKKLSPIEFHIPSLIPFICFMATALVLLYFTTKPLILKTKANQKVSESVLVFADFSPSVSASITIAEYKKKLLDFIMEQNTFAKVSFASSHSKKIWSGDTDQSIYSIRSDIANINFHRAGLDLGHALSLILEDTDDFTKIYVFTDQENLDLNWNNVEEKAEIHFFNLSLPKIENIFIKDIYYLAEPSSSIMEWEVKIARNYIAGDIEGVLSVWNGDDLLQKMPFKIADKYYESKVKINWQGNDPKIKASKLSWKIATKAKNKLLMDDEFLTPLFGKKQEMILVADPQGEVPFSDPGYFLKIAFEVHGIDIKRYDNLDFLEQKIVHKEKMQIYFVGNNHESSHYCPNIEKLKNNDNLLVWLTPYEVSNDFSTLCHCFSVLTQEADLYNKPAFCKDNLSKEAFSQVLFSLGGKKIGGEIGVEDAFAWSKVKGNLHVYAGLLPLIPSSRGPIPHSLMSTLIKDLLSAVGSNDIGASIARIEDISRTKNWILQGKNVSEDDLKYSNIPIFESMLTNDSFSMSHGLKNISSVNKKSDYEQEFPKQKAQILLSLLCGLLLLESIFSLRKRKKMTALLLFICFNKAEGEILHVLTSKPTVKGLSELLKEVEERTSLEFSKEINIIKNGRDINNHGFIWSTGTEMLHDADGKLSENVRRWLIRGGFLLIEGFKSKKDLDDLFAHVGEQKEKSGSWLPIGINHELLRSFYILKPLFPCGEIGWYGYFYDDRTAAIAFPQNFIGENDGTCYLEVDNEKSKRLFINLLMVAFTMDYKNSQVHINATLDRLRY